MACCSNKKVASKFDSFTFGVTIRHPTLKSPQIQIHFKIYAASFYMKFFKCSDSFGLHTMSSGTKKTTATAVPMKRKKKIHYHSTWPRESHAWWFRFATHLPYLQTCKTERNRRGRTCVAGQCEKPAITKEWERETEKKIIIFFHSHKPTTHIKRKRERKRKRQREGVTEYIVHFSI